MVLNMMAIGKKTNKMDMERRCGLMGHNLKGSTKRGKKKGKATLLGQTVLTM